MLLKEMWHKIYRILLEFILNKGDPLFFKEMLYKIYFKKEIIINVIALYFF